MRGWRPDLIAVAAFGRILPAVILQLPRSGCINVHGSLLPKYRGAGPIQWAIINGEDETGISTMFMDEGMDTGDILLQKSLPIRPDDTAGSLSARLAELGGRLLIDTIVQLQAGTLVRQPQDSSRVSMAPLLKKEDGLIDWTLSAPEIERRLRGMTPWPGVYTFAGDDRWTIWRAVPVDSMTAAPPGIVTSVTKEGIAVATGKGVLVITEIQPANGRRMAAGQYVAGHPITSGLQLTGQRHSHRDTLTDSPDQRLTIHRQTRTIPWSARMNFCAPHRP